MRAALFAALALALAALPRAAEACAVCTAGRDDETRSAFLATTLFLSVLPWALVGGFVLWLRRRARALARESEDAELSRTAASR